MYINPNSCLVVHTIVLKDNIRLKKLNFFFFIKIHIKLQYELRGNG